MALRATTFALYISFLPLLHASPEEIQNSEDIMDNGCRGVLQTLKIHERTSRSLISLISGATNTTDSSAFGMGAVVPQRIDDDKIHPRKVADGTMNAII